jgi:MGT family glycosyltransferase
MAGVEGLPRAVAGAAEGLVVLTPRAPTMLATLAVVGVSSRLAGELVVVGRRRLRLRGIGGMKILVAGWDSGGGVEVVEAVVRRAVARGHDVRVLGTEGLRSGFESAGAVFRRYRYAPDNDLRRPETDLVKDWEVRNPLRLWTRVRDRLLVGPASEFCRDVLEELRREPADVVVVDTMIPSAAFGAEAAGVPAVIVMHGPYMVPRAEAPPLGTGFMPARGSLGRLRDRSAAALALAVFRSGLPALNQARAGFGLAPLRDALDLMGKGSRILVCSSPSYDFAPGSVPGNVRYVGPQLDDAASAACRNPWTGPSGRPLVLVGLSSTVMRQESLLQRVADALGQLQVQGLITTGPAVDPALIAAPPNVTVARWVRHADVLPHCSAVITHGGHGTVMKALMAGIPLLVVPLGRDQPDNAARVVHAGAGIRLRKNASVHALRAATSLVIEDPRYRTAAGRMASRLAAEHDDNLVVDELEHIAAIALARRRGPAPSADTARTNGSPAAEPGEPPRLELPACPENLKPPDRLRRACP